MIIRIDCFQFSGVHTAHVGIDPMSCAIVMLDVASAITPGVGNTRAMRPSSNRDLNIMGD